MSGAGGGAGRFSLPSDWPADLAGARAMQERLRRHVVRSGSLRRPGRIAGIDVHFSGGREDPGHTWAAVALIDGHTLELEQSVLARRPTSFPYISGYLSFREIPAVLAALALLDAPPDLLMVDGQGIAHPRRLGIAAHLGVLTDLPAVGVAKSRLTGRHETPGEARGSSTPLVDKGETIGAVLRTKDGVRPLYVSIGHRIGLEEAIAVTLAATTRYRLPEPTRLADRISRLHPA